MFEVQWNVLLISDTISLVTLAVFCSPSPTSLHLLSLSPPQKLYDLGGEVADSAQKCTHLVANKVTRTVKFLTAISVVKHIVTPEWLEESWKSQKFVGESCVVRAWGLIYISINLDGSEAPCFISKPRCFVIKNEILMLWNHGMEYSSRVSPKK